MANKSVLAVLLVLCITAYSIDAYTRKYLGSGYLQSSRRYRTNGRTKYVSYYVPKGACYVSLKYNDRYGSTVGGWYGKATATWSSGNRLAKVKARVKGWGSISWTVWGWYR
ncbi:Hypothetical predicted protein [Paramuricea clavata]|uniref:Uncharacterized protein n=1 Tax=Paramuricea clavata TaxID=317549 RepID=A0A7D9DN71_PARCT|nr:Hypothetical predicted protein [Paramuricea clavata]